MILLHLIAMIPFALVSGIYIHDSDDKLMMKKQFMFPVMDNYMPHGKHLKLKRLLRKMGSDFDAEWMSVRTPDLSNVVPESTLKHVDGIDRLLQKNRINYLIDSHVSDFNNNNKTKETLFVFLEKLSHCEIRYQWDDLGSLFWPRYVKSGKCVTGDSCSWPPGMLCQSKKPKILKILNWRCVRKNANSKPVNGVQNNKSMDVRNVGKNKQIAGKIRLKTKRSITSVLKQNLRCRWRKITHEVIAKCECSC